MATDAELNVEFIDIMKSLDDFEQRVDFVVDRDELGDAMCCAVELGHRVAAITSRLGLLCTNNNVAAESGQRTIGQYVAARTNSRAVDCDHKVNRAKWLRDYPILEAAFGHELTNAHVDHLRKLDTSYETHTQLVIDQQLFVDAGADCSFKGFVKACKTWVIYNDPDGKEPKDQIEKAFFRVRKGRGGRGELKGQCDAVTAQAIDTAVNHEAEKLRRLDKKNGVERTDGNRRMAALAALVKRGFARQDGTYPVPLGNIVMSQKVAEWALATLAGADPGDHVPVHPSNVDGRCELIDGTPIHPFLAVHALGLVNTDGTTNPTILRRYVMEANSRILDVSVNARIFPEWMRTAATVQSRGQCDMPGCDNPYSWLQMDHIDPVANHGQTRFDNIQPGCRPDNQAKGATTGHTPWRDRPPPPRRRARRKSPPTSDPDADDTDNGIF